MVVCCGDGYGSSCDGHVDQRFASNNGGAREKIDDDEHDGLIGSRDERRRGLCKQVC